MRVLEVDLKTGVGSLVAFRSDWRELEQVASWGGSALAWALQVDALRSGREAVFVLAVGAAVRRGVPTAARVTVCGRGAHTGRIAEGAVGGSLGRRLATVADALVLRGRSPELGHSREAGRSSGPGRVLVVGGQGEVRWEAGLGAASVAEALERLAEVHPDAARLAVGPAAVRGVSFANLAVGAAPPSFVGRGGLGATLAGLGVEAIVVEAGEVEPDASAREWVELLADSPRLRERAAGGSMERAHEASLGEDADGRALGSALAEVGEAAGVGVRGCAGCPTPCGWVFETSGGGLTAGRFNALDSLGRALGLERPAEALEILAACDRVGVDAKEVGAALEVWARGRALGLCEDGPRMGVVEDYTRAIADLGRGAGMGWALAAGAEGLAARLGLAARTARGEAARPRHGLGGALALEVGARGAEPMRTFAFLLEGGVPLVRAQRIVAPLKLSKRGMDPGDGSEKGRLVWWHENFVAGIDSTGFCAFSAAGVLADGVMELEELAGALLERSPGRAAADELLGRGASLCLLAREVSGLEGAVRPRAEELADPWEEYRALRGLDAEGVVLAEVAACVGGAEVLRWDRAEESGSAVTRGGEAAGGRGVVSFTGVGEVGRALGGRVELELEFPIRLGAALGVLTRGREELRVLLFVKEEAIATGMRAGERVDLEDELADGDQVDLVMAVGGG